MKNDVKEIEIKGILPTSSGSALFLEADGKTFVIYVDPFVGNQITMSLNQVKKERPLTHDLVKNIFVGFGIEVDRAVIVDAKEGVFLARLILKISNELEHKIIELDCRPSDAILITFQAKKPVYVSKKVLDSVPDVSELLKNLMKSKDDNL